MLFRSIGWYSDDAKSVPLYRQFNPNVNPSASFNNSGSHNYTISKSENDYLASIGWRAEGIGWYAVSSEPPQDLKITDSTFSVDGNGAIDYVVEITNPNKTLWAYSVTIIATGYNADGTIAFSDDTNSYRILPNSSR